MIKFEILECPDHDFLGIYEVGKNYFTFGRTHGDLIINDPKLHGSHLKLEFEKNLLMAKIHPSITSFKVNKKRSTGQKILKINDTIQIGNTVLQINAFEYKPLQPKKEIFYKNLREILTDDNYGPIKDLINLLEEDLKNTEL